MNGVTKGVTYTWYEICNSEGHPLIIPQGDNSFLTEEDAALTAQDVCVAYRDAVTVKEHTTKITRVFEVQIDAVEV